MKQKKQKPYSIELSSLLRAILKDTEQQSDKVKIERRYDSQGDEKVHNDDYLRMQMGSLFILQPLKRR